MRRPVIAISILAAVAMMTARPLAVAAPLGAVPAVQACSLSAPGGYVVAIGYADGNGAKAEAAALAMARERMLGQACMGALSTRCAGGGPFIHDWTGGTTPRGVCALAAIEQSWLDQVENDRRDWAQGVRLLASNVAKASRGQVIALAEPRWAAAECSAGGTGTIVADFLRAALLDSGQTIVSGRSRANAPTLALRLSGNQTTLTVAATLESEGVIRELPGLTARLDTLGLGPESMNRCDVSGVSSLIPVRGIIKLSGREVEETHYVDGCASVAALLAAQASVPVTAEGVEKYASQSRSLCARYERFQLGSEEYAQRMDELDRWMRMGGLDAPSKSSGPFNLRVEAVRITGKSLHTGDIVVAGDRFKVRATPSQASHLYVVYENSTGERQVFPTTDDGVFVGAGQTTTLPTDTFEFEVDANGGRAEMVTVIASPDALPLSSGPTSALVNQARRARGINIVPSIVTTPNCDSPNSTVSEARRTRENGTCRETWYGDPDEAVSGYGAAVFTLTLDHR